MSLNFHFRSISVPSQTESQFSQFSPTSLFAPETAQSTQSRMSGYNSDQRQSLSGRLSRLSNSFPTGSSSRDHQQQQRPQSSQGNRSPSVDSSQSLRGGNGKRYSMDAAQQLDPAAFGQFLGCLRLASPPRSIQLLSIL